MTVGDDDDDDDAIVVVVVVVVAMVGDRDSHVESASPAAAKMSKSSGQDRQPDARRTTVDIPLLPLAAVPQRAPFERETVDSPETGTRARASVWIRWRGAVYQSPGVPPFEGPVCFRFRTRARLLACLRKGVSNGVDGLSRSGETRVRRVLLSPERRR